MTLVEETLTPVSSHHPATLAVDLAALLSNCDAIASRVSVPMTVVVKADAYGHGATEVAHTLQDHPSVAGFAAAQLDEGVALRRAGVRGEVLILSSGLAALSPSAARQACSALLEHRLTLGVSSLDELRVAVEQLGAMRTAGERRSLPVHLKLDTGMTRAGLERDEAIEGLALLRGSRALALAGVYTHLAESEDLKSSFTDLQVDRFEAWLTALALGTDSALIRHAANSAAALYRPRTRFDRVRVGGAIYGLDLAAEAVAERVALRSVMSVRTSLVQVRQVAVATTVGYGRRWKAQRPSRIGLAPIGYADGYRPDVEAGPQVLVSGQRVPVVGAVSMDLTTIDLTGTDARVGDEVVFLGRQGTAEITPAELAGWSRTGLYQAICALSRRLYRVFRPS